MNTNINLLLGKDDESVKRLKKVKILNFVAFMSLMGIGLASLIIFLLIQVINPSSIQKEQDEVLRKISQLQEKKAKLVIINDRINSIAEILEKRKNLSKTANTLLAKTPNKLLIENVEINDTVISLTAQSNSLAQIGEFINNLTDMVRKKEIINSLVLNTLAFDESKNSYAVSIKADL